MELPRRSAHEAALSLAYDDLDWSVAFDDGAKDVRRASAQDSKAALARVYSKAATLLQDGSIRTRKSLAAATSTQTLPRGVRSDEQVSVDGLSTPGDSFTSRMSVPPASAAITSAYDDLDWTTAVDDEAEDGVNDTDELPSSSTVSGMVSRASCLPGSFMWSASLQNHPLRSNADESARRPKTNSLTEVGASKLTKTRLGFWKNLSEGTRSTSSQITTTSSGGVVSPSTSEEPTVDPVLQSAEEATPDVGTGNQVVILKHRSSPKIEDVYGEAAWDELSDQGNDAAAGCVRLEEAAAAALAQRSRSIVGDGPQSEEEAAPPPPDELVQSTPHWGQQDGQLPASLCVLQEDSPQRVPDEQLRFEQERLEEEKFLLQQQRSELKRREQEWQLQQRREELALDQQRLQQSELERQLKQREDEGSRELYEERAMLQLQRQALEHAQELFKEQQRKEQLQRQQEERLLLERQERQMREVRQRQQAEEERLLMERQRKEQQQQRQLQEEERLQREQERLRQEHLKRKQEEGERVHREQQERLRRQEEEERLVRESDQRLIQEQQQRQQEEEALRRRELELHEQRRELHEQQQLREKQEQLEQLLQQQQQLQQQQAEVEQVLLQEEPVVLPRQPSPKPQAPPSPQVQLQTPVQWQWQQGYSQESAVQLEDELAQGQSPPRIPATCSFNRQASASIPYSSRGAPSPPTALRTARSPPSAEPVVAAQLAASPPTVTRAIRSPPSAEQVLAGQLSPEMQWMAHSSAVYSFGRCRLLDEKPVEEWDEQDVETWLLQFSTVPDELVAIIRSHAINGAVLLTLEEGDFAELGVTKFGHRRLLAVGAQELRASVQGRRTVANSVAAPAGGVCSPPANVIAAQGGVSIPQLHWVPPSPTVPPAVDQLFSSRSPQVAPVTVSVATTHSPSPVASSIRSTISCSPSRVQYRQVVSPLFTARGVVRMATNDPPLNTARPTTARAQPVSGPRAAEAQPKAWGQQGLSAVTVPGRPLESAPRSPKRSWSPNERWR